MNRTVSRPLDSSPPVLLEQVILAIAPVTGMTTKANMDIALPISNGAIPD